MTGNINGAIGWEIAMHCVISKQNQSTSTL
jgi:hypothetical protein